MASFQVTPAKKGVNLRTIVPDGVSADRTESQGGKGKHIILIRHGLSFMNEYIGENGITFGGPNFTDIFAPHEREQFYRDSPLSAKGQEQAKELGNIIESILEDQQDGPGSCLRNLELAVVSPLTRAIQTAQLALLPHLKRDNSIFSDRSIPVIALPLAAERLYLVSDIGKPKPELKEKYGNQIDFETEFVGSGHDGDSWWYQQNHSQPPAVPEWRPLGQGQSYFCPGEPYDVFESRMLALCSWLEERPESTVALVGHYGVFEWLLQGSEEANEKVKFGNCEMRVVEFETILERARKARIKTARIRLYSRWETKKLAS